MKGMDGNPHVGAAINNARQAGDVPLGNHSDYCNGQAQVAAMLAVAFELRTTNLIAFEQLSQRMHNTETHVIVAERLGLL